MTPDRLLTFVRPAFVIGGLLVSGAVAWVTLTNQVQMLRAESATKTEVRSVEQDVRAIRASQQRTEAMVQKLVCRQNPHDMEC